MNEKDENDLKNLRHEGFRIEEVIYEYAWHKGLSDFHCEWTNKDYRASDHNMLNMISDFIKALEINDRKEPIK